MFKSIKSKLIFPIIAVLLLLVVLIVVFVNISLQSLTDSLAAERIDMGSSAAENHLNMLEELNRMTARVISTSPQLVWFVRTWNFGIDDYERRLTIYNYLESRQQDLGITAFLIADEQGNTVMRTSDFENYGESVLSDPSISQALWHGEISSAYIPDEDEGIWLTSTVPIRDGGTIIGTVTTKISMGSTTFVDNLADIFNGEVTVFSGGVSVQSTLRLPGGDGIRAVGTAAREDIQEAVLIRREILTLDLDIFGVLPHTATYIPLPGWDGVPVGMFFVGFSNEARNEATDTMQVRLILIGIAGLIAAAMITLTILIKILKPLTGLAENARMVAKGKFSVNFDTSGKDEIGQVSGAFTEVVNSMDILVQNIEKGEDALKHGRLLEKLVDDRLEGAFKGILDRTNSIVNEAIGGYEKLSEPFMVVDRSMILQYANAIIRHKTGTDKEGCVGIHINDFLGINIADHAAITNAIKSGTAQLDNEIILNFNSREFDFNFSAIPFFSDETVTGVIILMTNTTAIKDMGRYSAKLNDYRHDRTGKLTDTIIAAFGNGNLSIDIPVSEYDQDTREIALEQDSVENVVKTATGTIKGYVSEIASILQEIASNNLDVSIKQSYMGDFGAIKDSIHMITDSVSMLISEIQTATAQVEQGSNQIAYANQELMSSFEEQATSIGEVREAVTVLTEKTKKNADDAIEANNLSTQVREAAAEGTMHMSNMSEAMEEIKRSSHEIVKVVGIIENIAFQTNLLALNASVEAARAGEHGRGFAVVAEEVRSLSGRSAAAAKETSDMLKKSLNSVDAGASMSELTSNALGNIVNITASVAEVVANIAKVSGEQAEEISKVSQSMALLNEGASDNSAAVQGNASVSQELSSQASVLRSLVGRFTVKNR